MTIENCYIEGVKIIKPNIFGDERGYFYEVYNKKVMKDAGVNDDFVQYNQSMSSKNVLRGLHFQKPPYAQAKLVRVISGAVIDVIVDIRKNSPTYGKHFSIELSEENKLLFYIPVGMAHGFLTLKDNTIFTYFVSDYFNKQSEGSLFWNDTDLGIDWPCKNPIISEKDKVENLIKNFNSPF
jgi:dTDP-4-dehydrorhamnose 3,5-epimerase